MRSAERAGERAEDAGRAGERADDAGRAGERGTSRPLRRAWLLLAVLVGSLVLQAATSPPADAQGSSTARLRLASQSSWVAPEGALELRVLPIGAAGLDLTFSVRRQVSSRTQFTRTLQGQSLGRSLVTSSAPLSDLERDAGGAVRISIPMVGLGPDPNGGVYPVVIDLVDGETLVDRLITHLVRLPTPSDAPPLAVAWVQPLEAAPGLAPDGSVKLRSDDLVRLRTVVDALSSSDAPMTLEPAPETLDALAVADDVLLAELVTSLPDRQTLARPYVDIDMPALARAGLGDVVTAERTAGQDTLAARLGLRPDGRTWSAEGPLAEGSLEQLRDLGVDRIVVPETALEPLDLPVTLTRPFSLEDADGGRLEAAAADTFLTDHFDDLEPVLAAHHLLADLAVLYFDAPGRQHRGVVVRPPAGWAPSADFLSTALAGLTTGPIVAPVTLDDFFDAVPVVDPEAETLVRHVVGAGAPGGVGPAAAELSRLEHSVKGLASMLGPGDAELEVLDRLLLVGQARSFDDRRRAAYADGVEGRVAAHLGQVSVVQQGSYRLTAREGTIPLTLVNRAGQDIKVKVVLRSDRLDFVGGTTTHQLDLTLTRENNPVEVGVRARSAGAFPLVVTVTSPDGSLEVGSFRLLVRSTAASWVGIVLSVGAMLFLLVWWGRHWRNVRRSRRLVAA